MLSPGYYSIRADQKNTLPCVDRTYLPDPVKHHSRLLQQLKSMCTKDWAMIVRDPTNDYGELWLEKHYEESHPRMAKAMENARRSADPGSAQNKE